MLRIMLENSIYYYLIVLNPNILVYIELINIYIIMANKNNNKISSSQNKVKLDSSFTSDFNKELKYDFIYKTLNNKMTDKPFMWSNPSELENYENKKLLNDNNILDFNKNKKKRDGNDNRIINNMSNARITGNIPINNYNENIYSAQGGNLNRHIEINKLRKESSSSYRGDSHNNNNNIKFDNSNLSTNDKKIISQQNACNSPYNRYLNKMNSIIEECYENNNSNNNNLYENNLNQNYMNYSHNQNNTNHVNNPYPHQFQYQVDNTTNDNSYAQNFNPQYTDTHVRRNPQNHQLMNPHTMNHSNMNACYSNIRNSNTNFNNNSNNNELNEIFQNEMNSELYGKYNNINKSKNHKMNMNLTQKPKTNKESGNSTLRFNNYMMYYMTKYQTPINNNKDISQQQMNNPNNSIINNFNSNNSLNFSNNNSYNPNINYHNNNNTNNNNNNYYFNNYNNDFQGFNSNTHTQNNEQHHDNKNSTMNNYINMRNTNFSSLNKDFNDCIDKKQLKKNNNNKNSNKQEKDQEVDSKGREKNVCYFINHNNLNNININELNTVSLQELSKKKLNNKSSSICRSSLIKETPHILKSNINDNNELNQYLSNLCSTKFPTQMKIYKDQKCNKDNKGNKNIITSLNISEETQNTAFVDNSILQKSAKALENHNNNIRQTTNNNANNNNNQPENYYLFYSLQQANTEITNLKSIISKLAKEVDKIKGENKRLKNSNKELEKSFNLNLKTQKIFYEKKVNQLIHEMYYPANFSPISEMSESFNNDSFDRLKVENKYNLSKEIQERALEHFESSDVIELISDDSSFVEERENSISDEIKMNNIKDIIDSNNWDKSFSDDKKVKRNKRNFAKSIL